MSATDEATTTHETVDRPGSLGAAYAGPDEPKPLGGYAILAGTFAASFVGGLVAARRAGHELPDLSAKDIVLTGVATHKLARLITKDKATAFLRAPFTRFQEASGHGEVEEAARGQGLRLAVGELLICPYCMAQWVAGAFTVGHVAAPRATRLLAAMWTVHAMADAVQLAYGEVERRAERRGGGGRRAGGRARPSAERHAHAGREA